jgi:hypothetical protein
MSNDKTIARLLESIRKHLKKNLMLTSDVLLFNIQTIDFILRSNSIRQKSIEEFKTKSNKILSEFI